MVRGSTEPLGEREGRQQHVSVEGREGRVTATRKTSLMTDKDARQDNTEHRRHRKVRMEKLGKSVESFKTLK